MLQIMLPNPAPVQAPAPVQTPQAPVQTPPAKTQRTRVQAPVSDPAPVVNTPPVVGAPLVAVVQAPAGVQQLVGQVQDLVIQHVAVVETPMEVEDEDAILQRLFFKQFGRALPEEKENDVDKINFVIDLTDEDEMEVATSDNVPTVAVVKTETIEIVNVANVSNVNNVNNERRHSSRLERLALSKAERQAITEFGKSLRKKDIIPEKEAPLAAGTENVVADNDSDMAEDNPVGSVNSVTTVNPESITTDNAIEMVEKAIAESDALIAANIKDLEKFY
jgi:hypothetical protein